MSSIPSKTTPARSANMPSIDSTVLPSADKLAQEPSSKTAPLMHWKERAALKRKEQVARIPPEWRLDPMPAPLPKSTLEYIESSSLLTALEHQITSILDATTLLAKITSREVTSVQVATAFCKRAAIAQQLSGCCTEMFFDKAIKSAEELDRHLAETGKVVGPLHGLPVSLKDGTDIEGEDSTLGTIARICMR
jgi:amidase